MELTADEELEQYFFQQKAFNVYQEHQNPHFTHVNESLSAAVVMLAARDESYLGMVHEGQQVKDPSTEFRRLADKYNDVKSESMSGAEFKTLRDEYKKLAHRAVERATIIVTTNNNAG
ncbi:MAG: hypothetical protein M1830_002619, partial [Pleopsidium flavum]